jgi:hypothetical protein
MCRPPEPGEVGEPRPGPSRDGSVVLDIGGDVGALVLQTAADLAGREIHARPDGGGPPIHTEVRERHLAAGTVYAAVFPSLPAGAWQVLPLEPGAPRRVTIVGGQVTEVRW